MNKSLFKVFFSRIKERKWLDSLGKEGYLLMGIKDSKYIFEVEAGKTYYYSVEWLGVSAQSDIAEEYYSSLEQQGIEVIATAGQWVYLCREGKEIDVSKSTLAKNSKCYRIKAIYFYAFSAVTALLCGYQWYAIDFLTNVGYESGVIQKLGTAAGTSLFSKLLSFLKKIVNLLINIVNGYFKLWTDLLGDSDAVRVIAVALPVTIVLIVLGSFNFDEYRLYKKLAAEKEEQLNSVAASEVSDAE